MIYFASCNAYLSINCSTFGITQHAFVMLDMQHAFVIYSWNHRLCLLLPSPYIMGYAAHDITQTCLLLLAWHTEKKKKFPFFLPLCAVLLPCNIHLLLTASRNMFVTPNAIECYSWQHTICVCYNITHCVCHSWHATCICYSCHQGTCVCYYW